MKELEIVLETEGTSEKEIDLISEGKIVYPSLENLTVTPTVEEQVFNHPNSYGYDEVRVEAVQGKSLEVTPSKEEQTFSDLYTNVKVNAIQTESLEVQPSIEEQSFNGLYDNVKVNAVTNEIDSNIVAENIKNDVEILGVKGNFTGGKYTPRYIGQSITFSNYTGTDLEYETSMLDTTYFTSFSNMFSNSSNLTKLDVSEWNTSNVTDINSMFYRCFKLTSLDLSNFDTSNVTNMGYIFAYSSAFTSLDLSSWNTSKVTNMSYMFRGCSKLNYLDIRNFTFDSVTSYSSMFYQVPADCLIIVKGETEKQWVLTNGYSNFTNIKTVAEL